MIGKKCFSHLETTQRLRREAVPGHESFLATEGQLECRSRRASYAGRLLRADRGGLHTSWKSNQGGSATGRDQGALWGAKVNTECLAGTKGETPGVGEGVEVHQQARWHSQAGDALERGWQGEHGHLLPLVEGAVQLKGTCFSGSFQNGPLQVAGGETPTHPVFRNLDEALKSLLSHPRQCNHDPLSFLPPRPWPFAELGHPPPRQPALPS